MADLAIAEIFNLVEEFDDSEGVKPSRKVYIAQLNRAIDIVSQLSGGFDVTFTNASGGTLSLSGYTVTFPNTLMSYRPKGVYWDDERLGRTSVKALDDYQADWRDNTGVPSYYAPIKTGFYLDSTPSGTTTGLLVVYGRRSIPHMADNTDTAKTSINYVPAFAQMALVDFVIASRPIRFKDKDAAQIAEMRYEREQAALRWDVARKEIRDFYRGVTTVKVQEVGF